MISIRPGSLSFLLAALVAACSAAPTTTDGPVAAKADEATSPTSVPVAASSREVWRKAMRKTPLPKDDGCFRVSHPSTAWEEIPCTTAPDVPLAPAARSGAGLVGPQVVVGGGTDFNSSVTSGTISLAEGSFPSITGLTSVSSYSLQLNSNRFSAGGALCGTVSPSSCTYWEQFVYNAAANSLYVQYWLVGHSAGNCPSSAWTYVPATKTTGSGCFTNSAAVPIPTQPLTNLANLVLTGTAGTGGGSDVISLSTGDGTLYSKPVASLLNLASGWTNAEFNIFGNSGGDQAAINPGASIVVRTVTDSLTPTTAAPTCGGTGFTAETNSLNLDLTSCSPGGGSEPQIQFLETGSSNAAALLPKAPACTFTGAAAATNDTVQISCVGGNPGDTVFAFQEVNGVWQAYTGPLTAPENVVATGGATMTLLGCSSNALWGTYASGDGYVYDLAPVEPGDVGCDATATTIQIPIYQPPSCVPATCSAGISCGVQSNGCGGTINCGGCASGLICSNAGTCANPAIAACLAKGWVWNSELNKCMEPKTFCGGKGQPACN